MNMDAELYAYLEPIAQTYAIDNDQPSEPSDDPPDWWLEQHMEVAQ
jgi:hypothetical protein